MKKTFKKTLSLLLTLVMIFGAVSVCASAIEINIDVNALAYEFRVNEYGTATLTKVTNTLIFDTDVVIPDTATIDNVKYAVQGIGSAAFSGCNKITSITIPEGVTTIGSRAFENCTSLATVNIPRTLARCEYDAFNGCGRVTVNCYKSNYQFFTVYGFNSNIEINVLDAGQTPEQSLKVNNILEMIKTIIYKILSIFGIRFSTAKPA